MSKSRAGQTVGYFISSGGVRFEVFRSKQENYIHYKSEEDGAA